ncbi:hypothetical protein PROFUN_08771 [Planoprotostelium fungivorum]|uniref:Uncharacterized protein n=1 Tax=Planoprotostelium fungivorum TaxID=1890364 RepID=A0A2P6MVP7_9EUKA|nr:hypothetical protein PROFUN_08771 [Planoprotostelium fungivorum]
MLRAATMGLNQHNGRPKKQFLWYKIPYSGLRNSAYVQQFGDLDKYPFVYFLSNQLAPPGMKIQHLHKGIREYVSRNPADLKDYLDEISAETKYLSTIQIGEEREWSRCKKEHRNEKGTNRMQKQDDVFRASAGRDAKGIGK